VAGDYDGSHYPGEYRSAPAAGSEFRERRKSAGRRSGEDRRKSQQPYTGPERRSGKDRRSGEDRRHATHDKQVTHYRLRSRAEQMYPGAFDGSNERFWRGLSDAQRDRLVKLQAIAMEKVGFEKGTPKFFISDDAGHMYAADEYFVAGERARPVRSQSTAGMSEAEMSYTEAASKRRKWLRDKKNRTRPVFRESESNAGMNFFPTKRAKSMAAAADARGREDVALDVTAFFIAGLLLGAGAFVLAAGLLGSFAPDIEPLVRRVMTIAGSISILLGFFIMIGARQH
jgi:hypothetical protein